MRRTLMTFLIVFGFSSLSAQALSQTTMHGVLYAEEVGAIGDGQHDDTQILQKAIDSLAGMGGGTLYLGTGTYIVSTLRLGAKVSLVGNGNGATVIKQALGQRMNCIVVMDIAAALRIADLTVLGNNENSGIFVEQSGGFGENHHYLYSNTSKWNKSQAYKWITIDNVCVYHFSVGLDIKRWGFNINVCNSTFSHNRRGVIMSCTDSFLYNCYVTNNSIAGLIVDGSNNKVSNVKSIFNCEDGNENNAAIMVYGSRCQLMNCETQDNYGKGFLVNGLYNEITNCLSNTDGYGKDAYRYDPALNACGFQINERYNSFSNCAVTNYNENYGAVYHSPVIIADSVAYYYPDIFEDIKVLIAKDRLMFQEPFRNVLTLPSKNTVKNLELGTIGGEKYFVSTRGASNSIKKQEVNLSSLQLLVDFRCIGDEGRLLSIDGDKSVSLVIEGKSIVLYCQKDKKVELLIDEDAVLDKDDLRLLAGFSLLQGKQYVTLQMFGKTAERGWIKKEVRQYINIPNSWIHKAIVKIGDNQIPVKRLVVTQVPLPESVAMPSSNTNRIYDSATIYVDAESCM